MATLSEDGRQAHQERKIDWKALQEVRKALQEGKEAVIESAQEGGHGIPLSIEAVHA